MLRLRRERELTARDKPVDWVALEKLFEKERLEHRTAGDMDSLPVFSACSVGAECVPFTGPSRTLGQGPVQWPAGRTPPGPGFRRGRARARPHRRRL